MGCEERLVIMKLIWHSYLVRSLDNCIMKLYNEIGLSRPSIGALTALQGSLVEDTVLGKLCLSF